MCDIFGKGLVKRVSSLPDVEGEISIWLSIHHEILILGYLFTYRP
jgi:hypothetical protein